MTTLAIETAARTTPSPAQPRAPHLRVVTPEEAAPIAPPIALEALPANDVGPAFKRSESIIILLGAATLGMCLGALLALIVGREATIAVQAALWLAFGYAFIHATRTLHDLVRQGAWAAAASYSLHLLAFGAWPLAVFMATPASSLFWAGPSLLLGTLIVFMCVGASARLVFPLSTHTILLGAVTALQAMLLTFAM